MTTTRQAVAPLSATRSAARSAANNNQQPAVQVQGMSLEDRMALMAELKLVAQEDVAPLEERKLELEAELAELDEKIKSLKPADDSLAVYRAVYKAVKSGNTTLEDIAEAAGHGTATVDAMLKKHLTGKGGKQPIFTLKDDQYSLTPKAKRS